MKNLTTSGSKASLLLVLLVVSYTAGTMLGGASEDKAATPEVQELIQPFKSEVEQKSGENFGEFTAVTYRTQVVAGTNYFVKVNVGGGKFVHLRIYKSLPGANAAPQLSAFLLNKTDSDPLEYFEKS